MTHHFKTKEFWQGIVSLVVLILVIIIGSRLLGLDNAHVYIQNAGPLAPLILIMVKAAVIVVAPLTGQSVYLLAAPLFGPIQAFIYLFIGDMLGFILAFAIGRFFGRRILKKVLSEYQLMRMDGLFSRVGTWQGFALARMVLLGFADITSYAAGFTQIPFWHYLLITAGMVVVNILFNLVISTAFITSPESFAIVVILCASFPFLALFIRHLIMKRK